MTTINRPDSHQHVLLRHHGNKQTRRTMTKYLISVLIIVQICLMFI